MTVKSTMFARRNIEKYTRTLLDGKTHSQSDHGLKDRQRNSSALNVQSFRAADYDTNHYLVVGKVGKRLAVNKQTSHNCIWRYSISST
jgi:3-methyladenine DNA glycosylase Mpg